MSISAISSASQAMTSLIGSVASSRGAVITGLGLLALANLPTVSAGPIAYATCLAVSGPMGPVICLPLLLAPGL